MTELERDLIAREAIVPGFDDGVLHAATDERAVMKSHASAQHGCNDLFFSGRDGGVARWILVTTRGDDRTREQHGGQDDAATACHAPA